MPLEIYKRGKIWWFRGRIEALPGSQYYRQSTEKTSEAGARAVVNTFERREIERHYGGSDTVTTFSEASLHYNANPEMAQDLEALMDYLGEIEITKITPKIVRDLGGKIYPNCSTDTWLRHVVTPVRAVINNAHQLGMCPPIRIDAYKAIDRQRQDALRGKQSRQPKTAATWGWIMKFRETAPPHLAALALFMFQTAARIGQSTQIRFADLDVENSRVWMPAAKGTPAQWVRLDSELTDELSKLRPRITRRANGRKLPSDRLFGYLRKDGVYKTWRRVCRDAGIEVIMPHAAGRHGFGTEMLVRQGLDPVTVAKAGRWSDPKMLLERYAHPEDHEERILAAIRTGRVQASNDTESNDMKGKENYDIG